MTLPDERYHSIIMARHLLTKLLSPKLTPRVPAVLRREARLCLRHFPSEWEMQETANLAPQVFQKEMEPLYRMVKQYDQDVKIEKT